MSDLIGFRVAVIATDGFEESELLIPVRALKENGAFVVIVSLKPGEIQGVRNDRDQGSRVPVDRVIRSGIAADFDAVHLPGGTVNADSLRMVPAVQEFLCEMNDAGKPIAAICHAPWELVSAGLVQGRRLTSYHTIQDDIKNAGGNWVDEEVVVDDHWITSRQPGDLPAFTEEMLAVFHEAAACLESYAEPAACA